ncbi:MAG: hypothetical protein AAF645_18235 [Myxococcota bacterium]
MHRFGLATALVLSLVLSGACGARSAQRTTPNPVELEPVRIEAQPDGAGGYEFEAYDANGLFQEGVRRSRAGECVSALPLYDRIVAEFASSQYAAPSHYNAGLCLKEQGERDASALRFEAMIRSYPESEDVDHARFQLIELYLDLERFDEGLETAARLLDGTRTPDERVEVMARHAQILLAQGERAEAAQKARETLRYARLRPEDDEVSVVYFLGAANYVLAETIRLDASEVVLPPGTIAVQRASLERRAQLLLRAQRAYFDTMRHTSAHWAAAAGYRIGAMYDAFWDAIMEAPVPPPAAEQGRPTLSGEELAYYEEQYRLSLASLAKPLIRHSIRYWELTLVMVERTGVDTEWSARIHEDLEAARARLLEQPDGPGGLPSTEPGMGGSAAAPPPADDGRLHYPSGGGRIE